MKQAIDSFERHPVVMWDLTRACDLHCRGCTTEAEWRGRSEDLSTYEAYKTVDQIAVLEPREVIITGGDPLERNDVDQIVDYCRRRGLDPAVTLSPTTHLTFEAIGRLRMNGLTRVIFSIDGSNPGRHEVVHGVPGTFATTIRAMGWASSAGLLIEVNTLVCRSNAGDLEAIASLIRSAGAVRWNLHFLVPAGHAREIQMIRADEVEQCFETIERIRAEEPFEIRVVEAPHYRRFRVQRALAARLRQAETWEDFSGFEEKDDQSYRSLLDSALDGARGFLFISHAGDVRVSEFAPQSAGNLRYRSLLNIYRTSDLFVALRDAANLKGKCGQCDFSRLCGGSRARAWAMTGDLFGSDPLCAYEPGGQALPPPTSPAREASA